MNEDLILTAKEKDLGGFSVARALPNIKRRHVGPFVFLDHMGPMIVDKSHFLNVRPHPHIGLATVTYLFSGEGHHRDNLGSSQIIKPGDLNWMIAGRGIAHSERTPEEHRAQLEGKEMHGLQIWVGLPLSHEECEPSFTHWPKEKLPCLEISKNISAHLLIGSFGGKSSPAEQLSPILFMILNCKNNTEESLSFNEKEIALYIVSGEGQVNGKAVKKNDLVVVADPKNIRIQFSADACIAIVGGDPFPEPRYIWWNFVSSKKESIRAAAEKWKSQQFAPVPGEHDFIPLPNDPLP